MTLRPEIRVVAFRASAHGAALRALLARSGGELPIAPAAAWLTLDAPLGRWVALAGRGLVGHVALTRAHPYLAGAIPELPAGRLGEVARLLVDPDWRGCGLGRLLLRRAAREARAGGLTPALAVLAGSAAALALYRAEGWTERTPFVGRQGLNLVFLDPPAPAD